jgi:sugar O-acyltransferase (sialic acid O-acetyltransferase NeuD family)
LQKIAIIGAGGLGIEIKLLIDQINNHSMKWEFLGFYDDNPNPAATHNSIQVLGEIEKLNNIREKTAIVVAIGNPEIKSAVVSRISNKNLWYPTLIHPGVTIDLTNRIGEGTIITNGTLLTVDIEIKNHVLLNLGCTVGHGVTIDDYSSIMPGVNISGNIKVGKKVLIGSGATIINGCIIGDNAVVGAGAVVIKDVMEKTVVAGVPAKQIK